MPADTSHGRAWQPGRRDAGRVAGRAESKSNDLRQGRSELSRSDLKNTSRLSNLTLVLASVQLVWLVWFYYTGFGGSLELVAHVMSIALVLQILFMYQQDYLYKWLPPIANHIIVAVYLGICAYAFIYFHV